MSHTPGPWELDSAKDRDGRHFIVHGPIPSGINPDFGYPVCDTSNKHHCITPKEDAANARLIAAAPDMLEALKELMAAFGGVQTHAQQEKWDKANAAIAAAEVQS